MKRFLVCIVDEGIGHGEVFHSKIVLAVDGAGALRAVGADAQKMGIGIFKFKDFEIEFKYQVHIFDLDKSL